MININTKKAYVIPIKNKKGKHITDEFKDFLYNKDFEIKSISMDYGSEFLNKDFEKLLEN